MKNITYIIILILIISRQVVPQCCLQDAELLQKSYNNQILKIPKSFNSIIETVNGFDNFRLGTDFAETMIATNPNDPLNSVCGFNMDRVYYTVDGFNWNNINPIPNGSADPFVCYDSLGNVYYISDVIPNFKIAKSTNKGISWNVYTVYSGLIDKPSIAAVQSGGPFRNYVYCIWQMNYINLFKSTNGGINWTEPQRVDISGGYCPWLAIGPDGATPGGSLYCGYNFSVADSFVVLLRRSTDGGDTFLNEVTVARFKHPGVSTCSYFIKNCHVQTNACIQMSADNSYGPNRGNVYIVYCAHGLNNDLADVFFISSTNYGLNWSTPRVVNDDNTITDQWMPSLSVDKISGRIYISWYDSRFDPSNLQTKLFGTISTDGGSTFTSNTAISTIPFNPQIVVQNFGGDGYMGHYNGISAVGHTSYAAWMDGRNNDMGSYTAYYPDFAMLANPNTVNIGSNDSVNVVIKVPAVNGPLTDRIKLTAVLDSIPQIGNIFYNFAGKDSISNIPDSVILKIRTSGVTIPHLHRIFVTAHGTYNGVPVHRRVINVLVNSSFLTIGTNREGRASFKVNGATYTTQQQMSFPNGTNVTVQAISPCGGSTRFIFLNWSDAGDTTHSFIINDNKNLTAFYKTQFQFTLVSSAENTFGTSGFYDSLQPNTFGVLSRHVNYNGQFYDFKGWNGLGIGSYTSPDTLGNDTAVTVNMSGWMMETARWNTPIGIKIISSEIPKEYKLYNNYPNPFNPSTTFKIDIPKESWTKLIIYDLLGKEIAELVNEKLPPGRYEVKWDGSNYASGVYLYKIQTGEFVQSKKMVLVK